jgi:predicted transposase YbfD/YdcC
MNMIGIVESERTVDGKNSMETRCYIGSIGTDTACFERAARGHWGVESALHRSLNTPFREDESRVRERVARENLAVLHHAALTSLMQDDAKISLRHRRNTAGWDQQYVAKLLFEPRPPKTPKNNIINLEYSWGSMRLSQQRSRALTAHPTPD